MEMKFNWWAGLPAVILFIVGFTYIKPETDFVQPGRWVHMVNRTSLDMYEAHLLPGQMVTLDFDEPLSFHKGVSRVCMLFEATKGRASIEVTTWTRDVTRNGRGKPYGVSDPVLSDAPHVRCLIQQIPMISISSATRQVVRVLVFHPVRGHPEPIRTGYQTGLCDTWAYDTCNRNPMTKTHEYFTPAEMSAHNIAEAKTGLLIVASGLGVLAVGHPTVLLYIIYMMLRAVFPSRAARSAAGELHGSKNTNRQYDSTKNDDFRHRSNSGFRRQQAVDDLEELTAAARAETERIKREVQEKRAKQDEYNRKTREADELKEKLKQKLAELRDMNGK
ncbi:hypothetical protein [uncultured Tateyamaria sp.]|uniref:hypothetical protein n=1 Tax=uncultured Tateyamaria sp. TaxID=455651 RepID=UPI0026291AF4|nr:hypothetical protein [uncultured Tateyamaria sp.]